MAIKLGSIIEISKGKKHNIVEIKSEKSKRVLSIVDLRNDKSIVYTNDTKGTEVLPNDVMIAWDGANAGTVECGKSGFIGSTIARLRFIEKNKYSAAFVTAYLKRQQAYLKKTSAGATIPHISRAALEAINIPEFGLEDQIRIAAILGYIEAVITTRKNSLQLLDDFLKSVFFEMFGPRNVDYEKWPLKEIKDLAAKHKGAMRTGPFGSNLLHGEFTEVGDVAVLGIDNAVKNRFSWDEKRFISMEKYVDLKSYRVFPDDVIITIMGTVGRSAVIPKNIPLAINTKHLAAITFNKKEVNPQFVSYSIHSSPFVVNQLISKNRGAIMSGLNLKIIKEIKIRKPPIGLQNKFSEIFNKVELLKDACYVNLQELESLYSLFSQKAFKGELNLNRVPLPFPDIDSLGLESEISYLLDKKSDLKNLESKENEVHIIIDGYFKDLKDEGGEFEFEALKQVVEFGLFSVLPDDQQISQMEIYEIIKKRIFYLLESKIFPLTQVVKDKSINKNHIKNNDTLNLKAIKLKIGRA